MPLSGSASMPPMENPERVKLVDSRWQSFLHPWKRKELDAKVLQATKDHFQEKLHVQDKREFDRLWNEVAKPLWSPASKLTEESLTALDSGFSQVIYNGKGLYHPDTSPQLEGSGKLAQEALQVLCHGASVSSNFIDKNLLLTVFVNADPEFMLKFYEAIQRELDFLAANPPQTEAEELIWRVYLGNLLGLVPFSYPATGTQLNIPVLQDGRCTAVRYTIEKIPMPLTRFASPMSAFGMTPEAGSNAQPILSFMGTTFPGAEGFLTTILSDTYPGHHVGGYVFDKNKELFDRWFEDKSDVHVVGISLGGALSLHAAKEYSEKIARVDAYNAAGVDTETWDAKLSDDCKVYIWCHAGDVVSEVGHWPTKPNVSVMRVIAHQEGVGEGALESHGRVLAGCKRVSVRKLDTQELNKSFKRGFMTFLHRYVGSWLVFVPTFCAAVIAELARGVYGVAKGVFNRISR